MQLNLALVLASTLAFACPLAYAQGGSPVPGGYGGSAMDASSASPSAPVPGSLTAGMRVAPAAKPKNNYDQLPISLYDAKQRLAELRAALQVSRPEELSVHVNHLCEWLADSADAHYKMASAFTKHDTLKPEAQAEKLAATRFSQLKNQAQLLKADILIAERRLPEALAPLVDIVLNEPTSATGQTAYDRLKEMGFSDEPIISADPTPAASGQPGQPVLRPPQKSATAPVAQAKPPAPKPAKLAAKAPARSGRH